MNTAKRYWLVKSEPEAYSIDNLAKDKTTSWDGVRNYQARNFLCEMRIGEEVLFYHSNAEPSGIAGLVVVSKIAEPDKLQFDSRSDYFDPKASLERPRWFAPKLKFKSKFKKLLSLEELRTVKDLKNMELLKRGSRLSVQPVSAVEFETILRLCRR